MYERIVNVSKRFVEMAAKKEKIGFSSASQAHGHPSERFQVAQFTSLDGLPMRHLLSAPGSGDSI
jgi:hypothetical protein